MVTGNIKWWYIKNMKEKINYPIEEINQNVVMSKKHKKVYTFLNDIVHLLITFSMVTACVWISAFVSLFSFPVYIAYSAIGLKISITTTGINPDLEGGAGVILPTPTPRIGLLKNGKSSKPGILQHSVTFY